MKAELPKLPQEMQHTGKHYPAYDEALVIAKETGMPVTIGEETCRGTTHEYFVRPDGTRDSIRWMF